MEANHPQRRNTDPGFDPAANTAPALPSDDLVGQAVERAAEKVASVSIPGGPPVMNRTEAFVALAILVIINLANLFVAVQGRTDMRHHRQDLRAVCELMAERIPATEDTASGLAALLAECLR